MVCFQTDAVKGIKTLLAWEAYVYMPPKMDREKKKKEKKAVVRGIEPCTFYV